MIQGTSDEMGCSTGWSQRFPPTSGEAVVDAESGFDGYGEYLDTVVLCD
jgi:hypothetical protein